MAGDGRGMKVEIEKIEEIGGMKVETDEIKEKNKGEGCEFHGSRARGEFQ